MFKHLWHYRPLFGEFLFTPPRFLVFFLGILIGISSFAINDPSGIRWKPFFFLGFCFAISILLLPGHLRELPEKIIVSPVCCAGVAYSGHGHVALPGVFLTDCRRHAFVVHAERAVLTELHLLAVHVYAGQVPPRGADHFPFVFGVAFLIRIVVCSRHSLSYVKQGKNNGGLPLP